MAEAQPAILLPGTLELSHALAARGVPVVAVAQGRDIVLRSSTSVDRALRAPDTWDGAFETWFNSAPLPRHGALLPGNDDAVWWLAKRGLGGVPPFAAVRDALVKFRAYERCMEAGLEVPQTWLAEPGSPLPDGPFPLVVKPQTRVGLRHWTRGRLVRDAAELAAAVEWFRGEVTYQRHVLADDPTLGQPIIQEYVVRPRREVYHVVGYRSRAGESVVAAHRKLLQYPLRFGSGLCFESAAVNAELAAGLERMFAAIGFHGIFEAEFVERDGRPLLIDLNPRSYNGMSLEVRRGYNLPWLHYLDTIGEADVLSAEMDRARGLTAKPMAWRDGVRFWTMLAGQGLSGGMSPRKVASWVRWSRRHRGTMVDAHFARGDMRAGLAAVGQHVASAALDPRAFVGTYVRRGLDR